MGKWRRWNNILHRDVGYLCVGLTIVYAVSGVAVNHTDVWNPTWDIDRRQASVAPLPAGDLAAPDNVRLVLERLDLEPEFRTTFRMNAATLRIFLEGGTVDVDTAGAATVELVRPRPVLHAFNFLHLNHPKKLWTWTADIYAVALILLAVTGLFVLKGTAGITGRGAWLTAIGAAIPVVFLLLYG
jgi:uncharacterized protein